LVGFLFLKRSNNYNMIVIDDLSTISIAYVEKKIVHKLNGTSKEKERQKTVKKGMKINL
jgi:hypothetical protein